MRVAIDALSTTDQSGWVDFIVKGNVAPLHKYPQATLVSVPSSRQVPLPAMEDTTLVRMLASGKVGVERNPIIAKLIDRISTERIQKTVEHLSMYFTRLATSETGHLLHARALHPPS